MTRGTLVRLRTCLPQIPIIRPLLFNILRNLPNRLILRLGNRRQSTICYRRRIRQIINNIKMRPLPITNSLILDMTLNILLIRHKLQLGVTRPRPPSPILRPVPRRQGRPIHVTNVIGSHTRLPRQICQILLFGGYPLIKLNLLRGTSRNVRGRPRLKIMTVPITNMTPNEKRRHHHGIQFGLLFNNIRKRS